jgi:hypothetical protein
MLTTGKQSRGELEKFAMYQEMVDVRRGSGMMGVNEGDNNLFGNDDDREDEENKNVVNI